MKDTMPDNIKQEQQKRLIKSLIEKLYSADNTIGKEDIKKIRAWIAEERLREEKDAALENEFYDRYKEEVDYELTDRKWLPIAQALDMDPYLLSKIRNNLLTQGREKSARRRSLWSRAAVIAAVITPLFVIATVLHLFVNETTDTLEQYAENFLTVITTGERSEDITLPDGSTVKLAPESFLSYPEDFENNRNVEIQGEGYFKVEKLAGIPFTVKTDDALITVLGTEFQVTARKEAPTTEIKLARGKINVHSAGKEITMVPGQHFTYRKETGSTYMTVIAKGKLMRLQGNNISFSGATLEEVFSTLGEYYEMNFNIAPDVSVKAPVTAEFDSGESLENILHLIRLTNELFDYTIEDGKVTITKSKQ